jgi:hypothetical protein
MLDWLDEDDIVHFIVETVETLDLSAFERDTEKSAWGQPALDPPIMVPCFYTPTARGSGRGGNLRRCACGT